MAIVPIVAIHKIDAASLIISRVTVGNSNFDCGQASFDQTWRVCDQSSACRLTNVPLILVDLLAKFLSPVSVKPLVAVVRLLRHLFLLTPFRGGRVPWIGGGVAAGW